MVFGFVRVGLDFGLRLGLLNFSFSWLEVGFWTMMARAELVEAGLGSGLARPRFIAQFATARLGAAFSRAGLGKNIGDRLGGARS